MFCEKSLTFALRNENDMGKLELIMETEKVSIYSPKYEGESMTEFEKFMSEGSQLKPPQLKKDFDAIISVINKMLDDCGARENMFRLEGGNIKAIPLWIERPRNKKSGTLRLYCIRISDRIIILGNGGIKLVDKYQDDPVLNTIVENLRGIEHDIFKKCKKHKIDYDDFDKIKGILENTTI